MGRGQKTTFNIYNYLRAIMKKFRKRKKFVIVNRYRNKIEFGKIIYIKTKNQGRTILFLDFNYIIVIYLTTILASKASFAISFNKEHLPLISISDVLDVAAPIKQFL